MFAKFTLMGWLCLAAQGQTPAFEAASIKKAIPLGTLGMRFNHSGGPGTRDPGLYRCQNCSLYMVVMEAFDIKLPVQLSGPDWLQDVRFDFSAKVPEGATKETFRAMLQNLLAERFKLAVHREKTEMAVYELTVAKNGPRFKESVPKEEPTEESLPGPLKTDSEGYPILRPGMVMAMNRGHGRLRSQNQSMAWLAGMLGGPLGGRPVVNATGLKGNYDYVLSWGIEERGADGTMEMTGPDLMTAVQSQLGLRLSEKKAQVEVLVVDHVEKAPTEN